MATEAVTADQPQTSTSGAPDTATSNLSSFLGIEPSLDTPTAGINPDEFVDPSADGEEGEGDDAGSEELEAEGSEGEEAEGEGEGDDAETQSTDDWLEDLTQREIQAYSKRYPSAWKMLTDPNTPEDVKHLLRDKINSDRTIALSRSAGEEIEGDEPTVDDEDDAEVEIPQAGAVDPAKQYQENLTKLVQSRVNPALINEFGKNVANTLLSVFGVDMSKINDEKLPPEAKAELQAVQQGIEKFAPALGSLMVTGVADLIQTLLPAVIGDHIESAFPGTIERFERQQYGDAWSAARAAVEGAGELPDFGTAEFRNAATAAATALAGSPELFEQMVIRSKNGKALAPEKQAEVKYRMLARQMIKAKPDPAVVARAVKTGEKNATRRGQTLAQGRALGAGTSTRSFDTAGGTGQDNLMDDLDAEIGRQNATMKPFGAKQRR